MRKIVLLLIILGSIQICAQESYNSEAFRVTLGDIAATTFKKDSTANALVIYESGNSHVSQNDYQLKTAVKYKIKILKTEGFEKATIKIYVYNNKSSAERVKNINATTYTLVEGSNDVIKTKLEDKNIYKEKYNENYTIFKFTLPNVKVGSVITYSYEFSSPFMFNYKGWNFQDDIPKLYSEYKTSIPGNWDYNIKLVGYKPLDINTSDIKKNCLEGPRGSSAGCSINHYAMRDIPAFIEEDYMTSSGNYKARIEYELKTFKGFDGLINDYTKTWETVDDELRSEPNIGKQLLKSVKLEELLSPEIIKETDDLKRAKSIFHYVQNTYTWNEEYKIFKDVSVKDLIKSKSGNVSAINILLHNLLKESNIMVKPVLLSTRSNGFPTKIYPVISDFNYLIVQATINEKTYLLDATDKYLSFGTIPFRCLNHNGRLLDFKNGSKWIDLIVNSISKVFYNVNLDIEEDDAFKGSINSKITGYHALNHKKEYFNSKDSYVEKTENAYTHIEITDFEVECDSKTTPVLKESYQVEYITDDNEGNIYLNPFFVSFFDENPFKLQERTYPIDFGYKDTYFYAIKLNLYGGYTVVETPENTKINLPNDAGEMTLSSKQIADSLIITFRINFNKAVYSPEFYPYLKEFMSKIVEIQNNSIVLLKKNV